MKNEEISKTDNEIGEITEILTNWNKAKVETLDEIFPKVYDNLKILAKKARKQIGLTDIEHTFNTLGLVNQTYLKLREAKSVNFQNRRRFYAFCLLLMKNFLIDYYRKKKSKEAEQALTDEIISVIEESSATSLNDFINLPFLGDDVGKFNKIELYILFDNLLVNLEKTAPVEADVIFLKYFLDLSTKEIAQQLGFKEAEIRRKETVGRAYIRKMLTNIEPIVEQAETLTHNSRNKYLNDICGEDINLLRDLEIILKKRAKM